MTKKGPIEMTPAPPVTEDDREAAKHLLTMIDMDRDAGREALEKICAAARSWAKSVGNK